MADSVLGGWSGQGPLEGGMASQGAAEENQVKESKGRWGGGSGVESVTTRALEEDMTLWVRPWALAAHPRVHPKMRCKEAAVDFKAHALCS